MNDRERFVATMHYQPRDRSPIWDFSFWDDTLPVWHSQGLPSYVTRATSDAYFGMDNGLEYGSAAVGVEAGLSPKFGYEVIEDRGEDELIRQDDGVIVVRTKVLGSIPQPQRHSLSDRASWRKLFKPRLDPDHPSRFPPDYRARLAEWRDPNRDYPLVLPGGSLYGWLRNWMGMEQLSLVIYDDPAWFEEMVETVADCIIGVLTKLLATGVKFEACGMWEDMAYNAGPLMSPKHFKQYLAPHYRRIADLLRSHDVDVIWVDCDGNIEKLVPHWLDAGINCMFPLEVGTWGADPVAYRRRYGKELLIMGGVDKHLLATTPAAIRAEVERLAPLVEEGGYIGFCDHRVPPDVPFANYLYYLDQARRVWGHNVNLRPVTWTVPYREMTA
jgi:uroporphyrinogen decarboxylase